MKMPGILERFFVPPSFEDENKTRSARLLNAILSFSSLSILLLVILIILNGIPRMLSAPLTPAIILVMFAANIGFLVWMRRGYVYQAGWAFLLLFYLLITAYIWSFSGLSAGVSYAYPLLIILAGLLLGVNAIWVFVALSFIAVSGTVIIEKLFGFIYPPFEISWSLVVILLFIFFITGLLLRFQVRNLNRALQLARTNEQSQIEANRQLDALRRSLEDQVVERTVALEKRARHLEVALEVGRVATLMRDMDKLFSTVANLIAERLDFYHVGIFILDKPAVESGPRYAVLRASNSEGGRLMLARGHRLEVGRQGVVGHVAQTGEVHVINDVSRDATFFANPLLPYTRSEVALPLTSGERILGVLDVQSSKPNAFSREDVEVLRLLADQLAVAIENVELFIQNREALEAQRRAYGEISRQAWREMLGAQGQIGYVCNALGTLPAPTDWRPEMIRVYQERQPVHPDRSTLVLPVEIRDHIEGVVRLCKEGDAGEWTEDEIALMRALTERLGVVLDSARLYRETRLRAAYQQQLGEVTSRIRQTLDIETVLRTAAEQVREALGLPEVVVQLTK